MLLHLSVSHSVHRCAWQRDMRSEGGMRGKGGMHAGETATEAGGTHTTGMHSCLNLLFQCLFVMSIFFSVSNKTLLINISLCINFRFWMVSKGCQAPVWMVSASFSAPSSPPF